MSLGLAYGDTWVFPRHAIALLYTNVISHNLNWTMCHQARRSVLTMVISISSWNMNLAGQVRLSSLFLVSGDADFEPAVKRVIQSQRISITLCHCHKTTSNGLKSYHTGYLCKACSSCYEITQDLINQCFLIWSDDLVRMVYMWNFGNYHESPSNLWHVGCRIIKSLDKGLINPVCRSTCLEESDWPLTTNKVISHRHCSSGCRWRLQTPEV